jgi:hypothetical protein
VFWTSTQTNQSQALERYLSHDNSTSGRLAWYKVMKYSIRCIKDSPTDIKNESIKINDYQLNQNYPNPFNPSTKIKYSITQPSNVVIKVFDILGNEIEILVNEEKQTGTYELTWNAEGLPSGVYFYRLQAGSFVETKKMILLK